MNLPTETKLQYIIIKYLEYIMQSKI